jgi:MinD superfamily P-loop ATPase
MKLAVASGKGGTGKTTVTACLARLLSGKVVAMDLDVEAPNLHLFLKPEITDEEVAMMMVPEVDQALCTHCRACADLCEFKAIADLGDFLLTFPEMCHGCGGCIAVCPVDALTPGERELGQIRWGKAGAVDFIEGCLRVGEAMSPPLMCAVKTRMESLFDTEGTTVVIDAPPGVSCPAVSAVMDSDMVVMVTEPTPFGLYDLELAYKAFKTMEIPMAVVINRHGRGDDEVDKFCRTVGLPIIGRIPFDRRIAEAYSQGIVPVDAVPELTTVFTEMIVALKRLESGPERQLEVGHA